MKVSKRASLNRYYLFKFKGYGVFIHRIHHSDPPTVMHTHPWTWISFILGSYKEYKPWFKPSTRKFINFLNYGKPHRIEIEKPIWSLFIHGPKRCEWTVTDLDGNPIEVAPWTGINNSDRVSYEIDKNS